MTASIICYGQTEKEKSVYSMNKDAPIIDEKKSEIKMDSAEQKSRTNVSMYKNVVGTSSENVNPSQADSTAAKQKMIMPATNKKETEVPK